MKAGLLALALWGTGRYITTTARSSAELFGVLISLFGPWRCNFEII